MTRRQAHTAASRRLGEVNIASPRLTEGLHPSVTVSEMESSSTQKLLTSHTYTY